MVSSIATPLLLGQEASMSTENGKRLRQPIAAPANGAGERRLTTPLIRRDGVLTAATWDEALGLVTRRFAAIKQEYGSKAFGCFSCSKSTNELNYMAQRFMRAV